MEVDEDGGATINGGGGGGGGGGAAESSLRGWHHSSRIIRVSRASGGKDRHSKVWTSKGLRDRRVRLSVTTAIQFYDLQDRLGYDQPSKAVEWLIKAAADSISELPSLNTSFPDTPKQLSDENKKGFEFDSADKFELDGNGNPCSSTSETSKNSGLSLSRSGIRVSRVKASRERAKERAAKDKEKEHVISHQNPSFTELLTSGTSPSASQQNPNARLWPVTQMDYFNSFPGQIQVLNTMHQHQRMEATSPFTLSSGQNNQQEMLQHFSFVQNPEVDYNLNFTISSSSNLAGFNRGTLQSNSPFLPHHHLQRFSSLDGSSSSSSPLYIAPPQPVENHHHHHHQFPAGLQLCYGDGTRSSDQKGKGKN